MNIKHQKGNAAMSMLLLALIILLAFPSKEEPEVKLTLDQIEQAISLSKKDPRVSKELHEFLQENPDPNEKEFSEINKLLLAIKVDEVTKDDDNSSEKSYIDEYFESKEKNEQIMSILNNEWINLITAFMLFTLIVTIGIRGLRS